MDALAHLKQGKSTDRSITTEEIEKDKDYSKNTGEGYRKAKDEKLGFYGNNYDDKLNNKNPEIVKGETISYRSSDFFKDQSDTGTEEIKLDNEVNGNSDKINEFNDNRNLDLFKDHPFYPIIERFSEISGVILEKSDILEISKVLNDYKFEDIDYNLVKDIGIRPELKIYLKNFLLKIKEFNKESYDGTDNSKFPDDFKSNNLLDKPDNPVVKILATNYLKIPSGFDGNPDLEMDIQTAFDLSLNKIIEGKNFPRTDGFEIAVKEIKNGNLEDKLSALSYVYYLVNTNEGIKGKVSNKLFKEFQKKSGEVRKKYLDEKIQDLNNILKNSEIGNKKRESIELSLFNLKIDLQEIDSGDIFEAGNLDKSPEVDPLANLDSK